MHVRAVLTPQHAPCRHQISPTCLEQRTLGFLNLGLTIKSGMTTHSGPLPRGLTEPPINPTTGIRPMKLSGLFPTSSIFGDFQAWTVESGEEPNRDDHARRCFSNWTTSMDWKSRLTSISLMRAKLMIRELCCWILAATETNMKITQAPRAHKLCLCSQLLDMLTKLGLPHLYRYLTGITQIIWLDTTCALVSRDHQHKYESETGEANICHFVDSTTCTCTRCTRYTNQQQPRCLRRNAAQQPKQASSSTGPNTNSTESPKTIQTTLAPTTIPPSPCLRKVRGRPRTRHLTISSTLLCSIVSIQ